MPEGRDQMGFVDDRIRRLGEQIVADHKEVVRGLGSAADSAEEARRWLILQALAIVGFVVPMLLRDTISPALMTARWACGALLLAIVFLFAWDTFAFVQKFLLVRSATAVATARLQKLRRDHVDALRGAGIQVEEDFMASEDPMVAAAQRQHETRGWVAIWVQTALSVLAKLLIVAGLFLLLQAFLQT